MLKRISEVTKGDSLASNVELIKNNARLGAKIAIALSKL
jgi:pseudouridine-5'-phosphate glycosidase